MAGELFAIAAMLIGAWALIAFFQFIMRNAGEALDPYATEFGDGGRLPEEAKARGGNSFEGEGSAHVAARAQSQTGMSLTHSEEAQ